VTWRTKCAPQEQFYENTRLIFAQNLRTIKKNPASAEEQVSTSSVKSVNKTAASAAQFAKCILLHAYSRYNLQLREHKQKLHSLFNVLA